MPVLISQDSKDSRYSLFASSAMPNQVDTAVKEGCGPRSIKSVTISSALPPSSWAPTVAALQRYLVPGFDLHVASGLLGTMIAGGLATPNSPTGTIQEQMQRDAQRQEAERMKIRRETETKIFELQQDITINQARTKDKAFKRWSEFIKG